MKQYDVLVVEDDVALCEALCDTLEIEGYQVVTACNGTEALLKLSKNTFKLVVSDVQMPVMNGLQLLDNMQSQYTNTPILLMTAYGSVPKAVEAIQAGASDYLIKPFDASALVDKVATLVQQNPIAANDRVVADGAMQRLYQLAAKVAQTDVTVLIQGASGTGKEVLAQYVHQHSLHHQGSFVAINCAAIPETMMESMLFGYEKAHLLALLKRCLVNLNKLRGALYCWMKYRKWIWVCRLNYYVLFRKRSRALGESAQN